MSVAPKLVADQPAGFGPALAQACLPHVAQAAGTAAFIDESTNMSCNTSATAPLHRRAVLSAAAAAGLGLTGCKAGYPDTPLPAVDYTRLDGQRQSTAAMAGQVLAVEFWATYCSTCVAEMPQWVALHQRLAPQGLKLLAVAMQGDAPARVANYAERQRLAFDVAIDNMGTLAKTLGKAYGSINATPTTLVFSKAGRLVWRHEGSLDFAALDKRLTGLLAA